MATLPKCVPSPIKIFSVSSAASSESRFSHPRVGAPLVSCSQYTGNLFFTRVLRPEMRQAGPAGISRIHTRRAPLSLVSPRTLACPLPRPPPPPQSQAHHHARDISLSRRGKGGFLPRRRANWMRRAAPVVAAAAAGGG
jgi:hypothetical protein